MSQYPPIQIVDEKDNPVGGADMHEAYDKGLIHRIVFVAVEDAAGRILLQKRSANVANHPNCWDISAGGHADEGEDYREAAERELKEELGIEGAELHEAGYFYVDDIISGRRLRRFNRLYRAVIDEGTTIRPEPFEVAETKWLSVSQIRQMIIEHPDEVASGLVQCFERYYPS